MGRLFILKRKTDIRRQLIIFFLSYESHHFSSMLGKDGRLEIDKSSTAVTFFHRDCFFRATIEQ
jgi:hypothetical protein